MGRCFEVDVKRIRRALQIETVKEAMPVWYARNRRSLPWRRRRDPYAIWISEIMLQQTRVAQAIPFYKRFMERFPDVQSLAKASLDDLLKAWEGMGYYCRARNLHRAARQIVEEFNGKLPGTVDELLLLPGIGRYTAGAIASIAFDHDEPVLDGNVMRVLCRIFAVIDDPKAKATQNRLWTLARDLIPPGKAGAFNQALMELGAMVCLPRNPRCDGCPVTTICLARIRKIQADLPLKKKKSPVPHKTEAAGVVWKKGRILICRRKPEGLLGGLWEIPGCEKRGGEPLEETLAKSIREKAGIEIRIDGPLVVVSHTYSHFHVTVSAFTCAWLSGRTRAGRGEALKWVKPPDLENYAFPAVVNKILAEVRYGGAP
ncbi:MAG: A/G-specific adenine glycosylase [Planctomycetota bacterium]